MIAFYSGDIHRTPVTCPDLCWGDTILTTQMPLTASVSEPRRGSQCASQGELCLVTALLRTAVTTPLASPLGTGYTSPQTACIRVDRSLHYPVAPALNLRLLQHF